MKTASSLLFKKLIAVRSVISGALLLLGGCGTAERVTTNTVLAHGNCKGIVEPIKVVSLAEVAALRGSQLLQETQSTTEKSTIKRKNEQVEQSLPLFVALSKGVQASRGFELHLADQAQIVSPNRLQIPVYWTQPDMTKTHPLVNTQPCLVVSIPNSGWLQIEAVDQNNVSLGTLKLPQPTLPEAVQK